MTADKATNAQPARGFTPSFRRLWGATVVSGLGDGARIATLPLLATVVTRDPLAVSIVTVASQLPWVVVGPITGVLTDRMDRRRLLWRSDVFQATMLVLFVVIAQTAGPNIPLLAVLAFVLGSAQTLGNNASVALVPQLAGGRKLDSANSWLQGGQFLTTEVIGVSLGVVLFGIAQMLPFLVDAVSFSLSALLVLSIRSTGAPIAGSRVTLRTVRSDIASGVLWLLRHRLLRTICVLISLGNFAVAGVLAVAALFALDVLGVSELVYGLLLSVVALGGLTGIVAASPLSSRLGRGRVLRLAFAMSPLGLLSTGLATHPLIATASFFFVGAGIALSNVVTMTMRQTLVPPDLFGRVNSSYRLGVFGLGPLGALVGGALASGFGLRAPFVFGAALMAISIVVALPVLNNRVVEQAEIDARTARLPECKENT